MKKIGEILKSEREKRDLSLHEIGMSLKINPKILKAIEEGDERNLPAKTFLRGFIRSYAQYLRLDVEDILRQFQEEVGSTRPAEPKEESSVVVPSPESPTPEAKIIRAKTEKPLGKAKDENLNPSSSSRVFTIVGAIILVLLIAFVAKMVEKYQKEAAHQELSETSTTTLVPPASESPAAAPAPSEGGIADSVPAEPSAGTKTGSDVGLATGSAAAGMSSEPPKSSQLLTPAPKSTSTSTVRTSSTTTTTLKAVAIIATPTTTTTTTTSSTSTSTVKATTTTTTIAKTTTTTTVATADKAVEVIIEAFNNVTISYAIANSTPETLEMAADQVHTFKGKGKITLNISDGGAVSVIVNGRDRGVPGAIGQPLKLSYP
jgi:cytoskeleton protein RodZ